MLLSKLRNILTVYQPLSNANKYSEIQKVANYIERRSIPHWRKFCSQTPHIVQMRGLEPETKESDIIDYFKPLGIIPKAVHLKFDGSGRVAGISEVEFSSHAEAVVAMRKKNAFMGNRFVRLTLRSSESESDEQSKTAPAKESQPQSQGKNTAEFNISENVAAPLYHTNHIIKMKNAPRRITDLAIYEFFWTVGASQISVKPVYNEIGVRTGEFEVQFLTKDDAIRAMFKNNAYLGKSFVELSFMK